MLKTPVIVLNVKTYAEATGKKVLEIANLMDKISKETGTSMAIAVQATDIAMCAKKIGIPVFAQHIDPIKPGSCTGWTLPEAVKSAGAVGTLINHSEHRLALADIDACIKRSKELDLDHIVCSNDVPTAKSIAAFSPNFIAVEPPELIGGDISVTTANPSIVSGTVDGISVADVEVRYPLRIKVQFSNTGNVVTAPQISVNIATQDGTAINNFTSNESKVKPGNRETIPVEWDTTGNEPGNYTTDVSVALGEDIIRTEKLSFAILPVGTLTRTGTLVELLLEGKPELGALAAIGATFINTGQIDTRAKFIGEVYYNGKLVDTIESEEILVPIGERDTLKSYLKVESPGEYIIKGYVNYEGKKTEIKEIPFTVASTSGVPTSQPSSSNTVPKLAINWTVLGGIIAAVIVVGLLILFLARRRAY